METHESLSETRSPARNIAPRPLPPVSVICSITKTLPDFTSLDSPQSAQQHLYQFGQFAIIHLYHAPVDEIARYDLAEMNLISAFGLPGTQRMDIGRMLARLDDWAKRIAAFTLKNIGVFHARRGEFGFLARYKITAMLHCLTREIGVRYNPERITDPDNFDDPADSFIHGILGPRRLGTSASLPVLLTSLGRRLGYPLKLVLAPSHCFCRWESSKERFNIEYHNEGFNSHSDQHYREWPQPWTAALQKHERKQPTFLISLTPTQELSYCAFTRACQLDIAGRRQEALDTMQAAYRWWPNRGAGVWVTHLLTKAMYPEKNWPHLPSKHTAGPEAVRRLVREKGVVVV